MPSNRNHSWIPSDVKTGGPCLSVNGHEKVISFCDIKSLYSAYVIVNPQAMLLRNLAAARQNGLTSPSSGQPLISNGCW